MICAMNILPPYPHKHPNSTLPISLIVVAGLFVLGERRAKSGGRRSEHGGPDYGLRKTDDGSRN